MEARQLPKEFLTFLAVNWGECQASFREAGRFIREELAAEVNSEAGKEVSAGQQGEEGDKRAEEGEAEASSGSCTEGISIG